MDPLFSRFLFLTFDSSIPLRLLPFIVLKQCESIAVSLYNHGNL
jgi:hypothetical protein